MTNILLVCDFEFDRAGTPTTGYSNIGVTLGNELTRRGHKVIGLGFSYDRREHQAIFGISGVPVNGIPLSVATLVKGIELKNAIFVSDVPLIEHILLGLQRNFPPFPADFKSTGIFAIESDPLCMSWALSLSVLTNRFVISQFGTDECNKVSLPAKHYPVPLDLNMWRMRTEEEHIKIKEALGLKDKHVLFVNADGNERKNTSAVLEALALAVKTNPNLHLVLLTRKNFQMSWKWDDLLNTLGIMRYVSIVDRGIPQSEVWSLYAAADSFWNMAKSEGLGLGILEAMAVGIPCVATNATAMKESLADGRGWLLDPDYRWIDPFGNTGRYFVFPEKIADAMIRLSALPYEALSEQVMKARIYVESRTVKDAVDTLQL